MYAILLGQTSLWPAKAEENMKIAIYARVSTTQQSTGMQTDDLVKFVEHRKDTIYDQYIDVGWSGTKESRPALDRLMADARKRKFDAVLVWRFDRFARSVKHMVTSLEEFNHLGISFISYNENLDTSSPIGKAMFAVIAAMAQLERDLIQERVSAGVHRVKARGGQWGPKAGYTLRNGRKAVPDNLNERSLLFTQGMSTRQAAEYLGVSRETVRRRLLAGR
jgi:DNA invertase Pin-like site-specific DNA recombinase